LVERFSSVMLLVGQALWLGWRRFAFRNIHVEGGAALLARGLTLYFAAAGFGTLAIAMLGPPVVRLLIAPEFAPAAPLIAPLTLSAFFSVFSFPLRMGLVKENRTITMSVIITISAVLTIGLALAVIPTYASAGAVAASLVGQLAGAALTWILAQQAYYVPFEVKRLVWLTAWFVAAYAASVLLEPLGSVATLGGAAVILAALPFLLYRFGPFSPYERERVAIALEPVLRRLRRA
jgi:O-antigen/teichoic acid export membrane protein